MQMYLKYYIMYEGDAILIVSSVGIIGEDGRMDYLAAMFYDAGYEVYRDDMEAYGADVLILPPVINSNNILFPLNTRIIYGGKIDFADYIIENNIYFYDYLKDKDFVEKNAVLTAAGIVGEALKNITEKNCRCLVAGYGNCGKAIAEALSNKGINVDILVRRKELKKKIVSKGYGFLQFVNANLKDYDLIFNTVPALVFDKKILETVNEHAVIYDIASAPGGVDFEYCRQKNIEAKLRLSIPGKCYPKDAARIIFDIVNNDINNFISKN